MSEGGGGGGGVSEGVTYIDPASPRLAYLTTNGLGTSVWRLPLATTLNDLPVGEGLLYYGGLGTATAITLFTLVHAALFAGRRRRRDLTSLVAATRHDPDLSADLAGVYESDGRWCGLRLTCELAARAGAHLDQEEKMMLSFFRGVVSAEDLEDLPTPQLYYSYASFLGFTKGAHDCPRLYPKCPYNARQMMRVFKKAYVLMNKERGSRADPLMPSH